MASGAERGRIVRRGMGGFLNPPTHPEHDFHVEMDLRRRPENRGGMSLSAAAEAEWLDSSTRAAARRMLREWEPPPIDDPDVMDWIRQVLGYFGGMYRNPNAPAGQEWDASVMLVDSSRDPIANADDHAGVHLIRRYYPDFMPTAADFGGAYWGTRPEHSPNAARTSDKLDIDQVAKLFGLPEYSDLSERNIDSTFEAGDYARQEALAEGASEDEADEANMKAQEEAEADLYHQWHGAVMAAAEGLFEKHDLTLVPAGRREAAYPYEYKIVPTESWEKAVRAIVQTVNGVGDFHFASVKEFLRSGPYTARQAVLTHLGYIASYPAVYGDTSAARIYERAFR